MFDQANYDKLLMLKESTPLNTAEIGVAQVFL